MLGRDGEALAMDVVRDGPRDARVAAAGQQRLPRRRGLLRLGRAGGVAARCRRGMPCCATAAWRCSTCTRSTPTASRGWRRVTHENVDLNRNFHDFSQPLPGNAGYDELAHLLVPEHWPPTAEVAGRHAAPRRRARPERHADGHHQRPVQPPAGPVLRRRQPDLEQRHAAPCAAGPRPALPAPGLDRPAHRPGPERPRRAHLRLPRRCRGAGARTRLVGRRGDLDLRRQVDLGAAAPA